MKSWDGTSGQVAHDVGRLLRVAGLRKLYVQQRQFSRQRFMIEALAQVDLSLAAGATLAVVGESGSGKSTLARLIARLEEPTSGEIIFAGQNLLLLPAAELRQARRNIQLIFQDAATALNPRLSALDIVSEPLLVQGQGSAREREQRALEALEQVGLPAAWAQRRPQQFSGGQRQRLAIARALTLRPRLLILDEALSGLDLSIQAQIANLLLELQARHGLAYIFISHDLNAVRRIADEVAVLDHGRIVEQAAPATLFHRPQHWKTRALINAIPGRNPARGVVAGD